MDMDGPYWSLAVEITFYFLISLLIGYYLLRYVDWFLLLWIGYVALPKLPYNGTLFTELFFRGYAIYFIAGMLFYLLQQPEGRTRFRFAMLSIAYLLAIKSCVGQAKVLPYHAHLNPLVISAIITSFFIIFGLIASRKINFGNYSWLKWLGALTYPLYLLHSDMALIAFHHLKADVNKYVLLGGAVTGMILLAFLTYWFVDKPFGKYIGVRLNRALAKLDNTPSASVQMQQTTVEDSPKNAGELVK